MRSEKPVSPYLRRSLRSLEEVLRQRRQRLVPLQAVERAPAADNANEPPHVLPPVKSA